MNATFVTYEVVSLDSDGRVTDVIDGEYGCISSCHKYIDILKVEDPEFWEDGSVGIQEIRRTLI